MSANELPPTALAHVRERFRVLRTVGCLLLAVPVALLLAGSALAVTRDEMDGLLPKVFGVMVPALVVACLAANQLIPGIIAEKAREQPLRNRLNAWQLATLIRLATCEGAALFAGVVLLLTASWIFLAYGALVLAYMACALPRRAGLAKALGLSADDAARL